MSDRTSRMLRVKAVAEYFDVSLATIYRAIESGQLRALKLGTGRGTLRVPESAVLAFADACGRESDEAAEHPETADPSRPATSRPGRADQRRPR